MLSRIDALSVSSERLVWLRQCAAAAAVIGGIAWTAKAAVTLAIGEEPRAAFAIGLALCPFALLGLWSLVRDGGRAARIGGLLAAAAAASTVLVLCGRAIGGTGVEGGEEEITILTPFIAIAGFGTFAALLALGIGVDSAGVVT